MDVFQASGYTYWPQYFFFPPISMWSSGAKLLYFLGSKNILIIGSHDLLYITSSKTLFFPVPGSDEMIES